MRRALLAIGVAAALVLPAGASAATFPGSNGQIAFQFTGLGSGEIAAIGPDGQGFMPLFTGPLDENSPSYSADGERIAFGSGPFMGQSDIWVMDADGQNATQITSGPDYESEPSFSPDGTRIAFDRTVGGQSDIFVMNADGSGVTPLTDTAAANEFGAEFSPDGNRIAFARGSGANTEIYVMGSGGQDPVPLTTSPADDRDPKWFPDGQTIVYDSDSGAGGDIYAVAATGGNAQPLTSGPANDIFPAPSPDGQRIVFTRETNLFLMDPDGGNQTPLTGFTSPDQAYRPDWQPLNPPVIDVTAGAQKSPKHVTVTVLAQNEDATATLGGTLQAPKPKPKVGASKSKTVALEPLSVQLQPGVPVTVEIPVAGKGAKLLKKSLKAGKKPKGTVTASATDDLGASSEASEGVKYKKRKHKK